MSSAVSVFRWSEQDQRRRGEIERGTKHERRGVAAGRVVHGAEHLGSQLGRAPLVRGMAKAQQQAHRDRIAVQLAQRVAQRFSRRLITRSAG